MQKVVVMSVGGSVINPGEIRHEFLERLFSLVTRSPHKFILICGGGINARTYMEAARAFGVAGDSLDEIGIQATMLNAELIAKLVRAKEVHRKPRKVAFKKVLVAGGYKPGCSSDYDAVLWAKAFRQKRIINVSNTDYVYDKDPKDPLAKPFRELSWAQFRKRFGDKWVSGAHIPFDPIAAKAAQKGKLQVCCINGSRLEEIDNILGNRPVEGTWIR